MPNWQVDKYGDDSGDEEDGAGAGAGASWLYTGRTGTIFLIDAAREMFDEPAGEEEEESPFKRAIKAVHATLMNRAFGKPQDTLAVVLFNTRESKNQVEYPNVYVLQELERPGAENVLAMEDLMDMSQAQFETKFGHSTNASIHDALRTCQSIYSTSDKHHPSKTVLLCTCRDDPHPDNPQKCRQATAKAKDLKESFIALEILHMGASFDIDKFYKDLILPDTLDEDEEEGGGSGGVVSREMRTLADPSTRFEELMNRVNHLANKQRVSAKVVLTLAPNVSMGVGVYSLVKQPQKPKKKKLWKNTNEEIKTIIKDYLPRTGELVNRSEFQYYQKYGNRKICLTRDEAQDIGNVYEPGMELLGFRPMSWLKNLYFYKASKFMYPKEDQMTGSTKLFTALLERCLERKVVPIVRLVTRLRTNIAMAALIPQQEVLDSTKAQEFPPGFVVYHLPLADNFSTSEVRSDRSQATTKQVDVAKKLVKKLHFDYTVSTFDNPDVETMQEIIKALALNRSQLEPVADFTVPKTSEMEKRAGAQMREFERQAFQTPNSLHARTISATSALLASKRVKLDQDNLDVEIMVKRGQAQQLTVPKLKSWLTARGVSVSGKKKAELMQAVIDAVCA